MRYTRRLALPLFALAALSLSISPAVGGEIHDLAVAGDAAAVAELLRNRPSAVNEADAKGYTPVMLAVQHGRGEVLETLLKFSPDLAAADGSGFTPLHWAVFSRRREMAEPILAAGGDPLAEDHKGKSPLDYAAGYIMPPKYSLAPLLVAAVPDAQEKLKSGDYPLHFAAARGYEEAVVRLIDRGASLDARDQDGRTALDLAIAAGHTTCAARLIVAGPPTESRKYRRSRTSIATDQSGRYLLWSVEHGEDEATAALLLRGTDPNSRGEGGVTPLHAAALAGNDDAVARLIEAGADANLADESGHTPLHSAAWSGRSGIVRLLLEAGGLPNAGRTGYTPLHAAAWMGQPEVAKLLLAAGADVSAADLDGQTPLHKAAWRGHVGICRILLAAGANATLRDIDGFTPRDKARSAGHETLAALLSESIIRNR